MNYLSDCEVLNVPSWRCPICGSNHVRIVLLDAPEWRENAFYATTIITPTCGVIIIEVNTATLETVIISIPTAKERDWININERRN